MNPLSRNPGSAPAKTRKPKYQSRCQRLAELLLPGGGLWIQLIAQCALTKQGYYGRIRIARHIVSYIIFSAPGKCCGKNLDACCTSSGTPWCEYK